MNAAVYFCTSMFALPPLRHVHLTVTKGWVISPPTGMTVIVVPVNGTLSYVELSPSRPQQLAEARRINLPSFSQLTHSLSLSLLSHRYNFFPLLPFHGLCGTNVPPPENLPKKRLTKTKHEPFIFLCNKKRSVRGLGKVTEVAIDAGR